MASTEHASPPPVRDPANAPRLCPVCSQMCAAARSFARVCALRVRALKLVVTHVAVCICDCMLCCRSALRSRGTSPRSCSVIGVLGATCLALFRVCCSSCCICVLLCRVSSICSAVLCCVQIMCFAVSLLCCAARCCSAVANSGCPVCTHPVAVRLAVVCHRWN